MALNYNKRLQNVQNRKFDSFLNERLTSRNFSTSALSGKVKYLLEAMMPIGPKSNARTIQASQNVKNHLESSLDLHFERDYERQGSVETDTNIRVSDVDLLAIIRRYHFLHPGMPNDFPYTESDPNQDIAEFRRQAIKILKSQYDNVTEKEKCVTILNKHLGRYVDVVFAFWHNTPNYERTNDIYHRGIKIGSRHARVDYPFAHIYNVNKKGGDTADGSRRAIRLLKTLVEDCETAKIENLSSFHLTTIVHQIENYQLLYTPGATADLEIAKAVSRMFHNVINNEAFRNSLQSPNGCERPLSGQNLVRELNIIKNDLDELIADVEAEIMTNFMTKSGILAY